MRSPPARPSLFSRPERDGVRPREAGPPSGPTRPGRSRVAERTVLLGLGVLILGLAIVNAGIGGRDRLLILALLAVGTAVVWWSSRSTRDGEGAAAGSRPPGPPDAPRRRGGGSEDADLRDGPPDG